MEELLEAHCKRYPQMQVSDLYKLIHQACMGSEHVGVSPDRARGWLMGELADLGDGPEEPLVDPISLEGEIVRVHLRPYVRAGYDPERLLHAFVQTSSLCRGSVERLAQFGEVARAMAAEGLLPFDVAEIAGFFRDRELHGFPAVHHSAVYKSLYRPAYRVVYRAYLELS